MIKLVYYNYGEKSVLLVALNERGIIPVLGGGNMLYSLTIQQGPTNSYSRRCRVLVKTHNVDMS